MTYLDTDKQTLADLSIVDSVYNERPLYSLFSATETKKGKRLMLHWITSPLSDLSAIQKRQEAIAWKKLPELPLDEYRPIFWNMPNTSRKTMHAVSIIWIQKSKMTSSSALIDCSKAYPKHRSVTGW